MQKFIELYNSSYQSVNSSSQKVSLSKNLLNPLPASLKRKRKLSGFSLSHKLNDQDLKSQNLDRSLYYDESGKLEESKMRDFKKNQNAESNWFF
mgnify:CR=1 FL=1